MDDPVTFARKLRRQQTPAERRFWALLHPWRSAGCTGGDRRRWGLCRRLRL